MPSFIRSIHSPVTIIHQAVAPGETRHWHVRQCKPELLGTSFDNEDDVLLGTTVALSSLDDSRLAVGAPIHNYSATEANAISVNDNGGAIF